MNRVYLEKTSDRGGEQRCGVSNNYCTYIITSARMKDLFFEYKKRFHRLPTSKWFRSHCNFERVQ